MPPVAQRRLWTPWALAFGLVTAVVVVYLPALEAGFIWNDSDYVTRAELRTWAGLGRIWFEVGATEQYYPLLHSFFWWQHQLWGDAPFGYHLVGVLLHAGNACLLALCLRRWEVPGAWLAAYVFALHPVCVESVAWVAEQKNTLSLAFYLGAALAYDAFDRGRGGKAYVLATGLFLLALLSKTTTATLAPALAVIMWWRRGRLEWRRDALPLLPWMAMATVAGLFSAWVERIYIGAEGAEFSLGGVERLLLAGRVVWFYVGKLVWPVDLVFIYPRWSIATDSWTQALALLGALAALAVAWAIRRRTRAPLAAALFFGGSLFPVLGFFNVYGFLFSYVADHWQYLPCLGLIVLICSAATRYAAGFPLIARGIAVLVTLTALGLLSSRQSRMYRDIESFYRTILADNPAAWMAHNNLGSLLRERGQWEEAEQHFKETLRYRPHSAKAHHNLGTLAQDRRRWIEAVDLYGEAVRRAPGNADYHNHLAGALREVGRLDEAVTHHRESLRIDPASHAAHNNAGVTLRALGRLPEALAAFEQAARLEPRSAPAQLNLALTYSLMGRENESRRHYDRARQLNPALPALPR